MSAVADRGELQEACLRLNAEDPIRERRTSVDGCRPPSVHAPRSAVYATAAPAEPRGAAGPAQHLGMRRLCPGPVAERRQAAPPRPPRPRRWPAPRPNLIAVGPQAPGRLDRSAPDRPVVEEPGHCAADGLRAANPVSDPPGVESGELVLRKVDDDSHDVIIGRHYPAEKRRRPSNSALEMAGPMIHVSRS